ncbi:hypothetical protein F3Y22_tig00111330pilonHSYRG01243 [Hibiscus syriacus]|uniref:Uncharacterized protein n=1 Tax=Hibiscus syriacus TaxID=106335 RepID=A0A6A2YQF2_HIBSY|nr:hypothetical protein F3Y22_tig00111330pilonHSYRG01243 [Hibiscus syriacus]
MKAKIRRLRFVVITHRPSSEIYIPITVGINGLHHSCTIIDPTLHSQLIQNKMQLVHRDQAVLVPFRQIEGDGDSIGRRAAQSGELGQINDAVFFGVDVFQDMFQFILRVAAGAH